MTPAEIPEGVELAAVLDRISDVFFAVDDEWRITYLNARAEALLGRPAGELLGTEVWAAYPTSAGTIFHERLERAMADQEVVSFVAPFEGTNRWFDVRAYPSPTGLSIFFREVTDERRLEDRRLGYETVLDEMADGVVVVDDDGAILFVNRTVADRAGQPRPAVEGEDVRRLVPRFFADDEAGTTFVGLVESILDGDREKGRIAVPIAADGDATQIVDIQLTVLDLGSGRRGAVAVARDVTDDWERERELARLHGELSTVLDTVSAGIVTKDLDGRYRLANDWAREIVGADEAAVAGSTDADWFPPATAERFHEYDRRVLEAGASVEFEESLETPSGTRVLRTIVSPMYDADGEPLGVCAVVTDVTDREERERRLEVLNDRLRLLNRIVRHDIRNDMNVIVGWGGQLEGHVDEAGGPILDRIERTSRHVVDLTTTVKEFVEVFGTDGRPALEPTDLAAVFEAELEMRRSTHPEATIRVADPVPEVTVEANELLSSVFRNLINNAVQHNDEPTPVVEVGFAVDDGAVTIEVADNGPGIPDERKAAVFGRSESRLEDPSAGIGLYLVDSLVADFGGEIWIEDNEPKGAVFVVRMPILSEE